MSDGQKDGGLTKVQLDTRDLQKNLIVLNYIFFSYAIIPLLAKLRKIFRSNYIYRHPE